MSQAFTFSRFYVRKPYIPPLRGHGLPSMKAADFLVASLMTLTRSVRVYMVSSRNLEPHNNRMRFEEIAHHLIMLCLHFLTEIVVKMAFSESIFDKMTFLYFPPHNDEFSSFLHKNGIWIILKVFLKLTYSIHVALIFKTFEKSIFFCLRPSFFLKFYVKKLGCRASLRKTLKNEGMRQIILFFQNVQNINATWICKL